MQAGTAAELGSLARDGAPLQQRVAPPRAAHPAQHRRHHCLLVAVPRAELLAQQLRLTELLCSCCAAQLCHALHRSRASCQLLPSAPALSEQLCLLLGGSWRRSEGSSSADQRHFELRRGR